MKLLTELSANELQWFPELGIGYYPVKDAPYNKDYFDKYVAMEDSKIGVQLNSARIELVKLFTDKEVLDIGIGSGIFVSELNAEGIDCSGYDINTHAVAWLNKHGLYKSPFTRPFKNATFWDSLEHIHKPKTILDNIEEYAFVSCPIYRDSEHLLKSKHFRKDEHCWYWTSNGLKVFMEHHNFKLVHSNQMESEIGREDIGSFVFRKSK